MQVEQLQTYGVNVFKEEIQLGHLDDAEQTQSEILRIDERHREVLPCEGTQVEYIGSHIDAQGDGEQCHHRQQHLVHQSEDPVLGDRLVVDLVFLTVILHPAGDTSDGQDAGQLHDPPDEQLNTHQGVAYPCADGAHKEDDQ